MCSVCVCDGVSDGSMGEMEQGSDGAREWVME